MMLLTEKYRPKLLAEIIGQDHVVAALADYVRRPYPAAFLFSGYTGTGKTSAAYALALELGCAVQYEELGGFHEIASGEQTAESVRRKLNSMSYRPFYGSGWKVLVVNECDRMNPQVETIWLDALEALPDSVTVVFTTNNAAALADRFVDRTEHVEFSSSIQSLRGAAAALASRIWQAETGETEAPRIELSKIVRDGNISLRRVVQAMAPLIRGHHA